MTLEDFCTEQARQIRFRLARHREPAMSVEPFRAKKHRPAPGNGATEHQCRHPYQYVRCGCGGFKRIESEMCKVCKEGQRRPTTLGRAGRRHRVA